MQSLLRGSKIGRLHKLDGCRMRGFLRADDRFFLSLWLSGPLPSLYRISRRRAGLSDSGAITGLGPPNGLLCQEIYSVSLAPILKRISQVLPLPVEGLFYGRPP